MSTSGDDPSKSGADKPKSARRFQTNVRTLIVLVACGGVTLWAVRRLRENYDPVLVEARAIQERAIGALQSGKPAERIAAIQELERLRRADKAIAIPPLIASLEDADTQVRIAAAQAVSSLAASVAKSRSGTEPVRTAAMALIRCLEDPDKAVRLAGAEALGWIGTSLVESGSGGETIGASATPLIACLKDPAPGVRSAAATSLGKIASPRLASVANCPISRQAILDALARMLGDSDAKVRLAAIHGMASYPLGTDAPQALAEGLKDDSAENRVAAIRGLNLRRQGLDPWVPILLQLAERDPDPSVRDQCFTTMNYAFKPPAVTPAVIPSLIANLRSDNAKIRTWAASALSEFRANANAAIPALLRVLNEPLDPTVIPRQGPSGTFDPACQAAFALGRIAPGSAESKKVIAALIEVVNSGPPSRGGWAAVALGEFGPAAEEAVPVLIQLIKDATPDDEFEREASAVSALGKIAPDTRSAEHAVTALLPVLESKPSLSRTEAMKALSRFGPRAAAAIPRIRALKNDRDPELRNAAAKALPAIEILGR